MIDERLGPRFQGIFELEQRPILVAALYDDPYMRRRFLRRLNVIWNICTLPDQRVASTLLDCYWKSNVRPYIASFRAHHNDYPDYLLSNEVEATLRNVRRNAMLRLGVFNIQSVTMRERDTMRPFGEEVEM